MYLDDIRIAPQEIVRVMWRKGRLVLDVRWHFEDLPILFDLPRESLLRWHEDDPKAGIPVELRRWRFGGDGNGVRLTFRC